MQGEKERADVDTIRSLFGLWGMVSHLRMQLPFFARRKVAKTRWERQEKLCSFCLPFPKPCFYEGPFESCKLLQFGALRLSIWCSLRMCSPHLRWNIDSLIHPKDISASARQRGVIVRSKATRQSVPLCEKNGFPRQCAHCLGLTK